MTTSITLACLAATAFTLAWGKPAAEATQPENPSLRTAAVFPGKTWATKPPFEAGLDAAQLKVFSDFVGGRGCVVRHGHMIYSWGDQALRGHNHSTFCDLIISGLVGLRPRTDEVVEVNPLAPGGTWDWFCLEGVAYHGRTLTILWDKTGQKYRRAAGLRALADGQEIAHAPQLQRVSSKLPSWVG